MVLIFAFMFGNACIDSMRRYTRSNPINFYVRFLRFDAETIWHDSHFITCYQQANKIPAFYTRTSTISERKTKAHTVRTNDTFYRIYI